MRESLARGVIAGYPMIDVKVTPDRRQLPRRRLVGEMAFELARLDVLREAAAREAKPILLEPIMAGRGADPGRVHGRGDRRT